MAKVLVKIQMGYNSQLIMDSETATTLLNIISDAATVDVAYDSLKLTPASPAEVFISSMGKHEVVCADAV